MPVASEVREEDVTRFGLFVARMKKLVDKRSIDRAVPQLEQRRDRPSLARIVTVVMEAFGHDPLTSNRRRADDVPPVHIDEVRPRNDVSTPINASRCALSCALIPLTHFGDDLCDFACRPGLRFPDPSNQLHCPRGSADIRLDCAP